MPKITGNSTVTPVAIPDWNQKDATKVNYIKNKPEYENEFANSIKGNATAVNVLVVDDVSSVSHKMNLTLESANLIDMSSAMTIGYRLPVEVGKTYTISAKVNDNVSFNGKYWGVKWKETIEGTEVNTDVIYFYDGYSKKEASYSFTVGVNNSRDYYIDRNGFTQEDFEYIQLNEGATALPYTPFIKDIDNVKVKSCGKNIFDNNKDEWSSSGVYYVKPLPLPHNIPVTVSGHYFIEKPNGIIYIQKSIDGGSFKTITELGVLAATVKKNINITKQSNEEYRLLLSGDTYIDVTNGNFLKGIQVELGTLGAKVYTEYEEYKGNDDAVSIFPSTTLVADTDGVKITADYSKDINKVIARLEQAIANL